MGESGGPAGALPALAIEGLAVRIGGRRAVEVVSDFHVAVAPGGAVAVVGESGSGKTVAFLAALGRLGREAEVTGSVRVAGLAAPLPVRSGAGRSSVAMAEQDAQAALDPSRPVGRLIGEGIRRASGVGRGEARRRAVELLAEVGLPDPKVAAEALPHELSGGLCQRAMLATALAGDPAVLVADEPLRELDLGGRAAVLGLLAARRAQGLAVVLVTQDLAVAADFAEEVAIVCSGRTVEMRPMAQAWAAPRHPYTAALLAVAREGPVAAMPGGAPLPGAVPPGCPFHSRCPRRTEICARVAPALAPLAGEEGTVACHHPLG